jgi:hypothetical protein
MAVVFKNTARADGVGDLITTVGTPTLGVAGKLDLAVQFPGTGECHLDTDVGVIEPTYPCTWSCWVYPTSWVSWAAPLIKPISGYVSPYRTFGFQLTAAGTGQWRVGFALGATGNGTDTTLTVAALMVLNQWNHLGCTYDGTTIRTYLNGVASSTLAASGILNYVGSHSMPWQIGGYAVTGGPGPTWAGKIDDVRIAGVVRDATWFSSVWATAPPSFTDSEIDGRSRAGGDLGGTTAAGASDAPTTFRTTGGRYHIQPTVGRGTIVDKRQGRSTGIPSENDEGTEAAGIGDANAFKPLGTTGLRTPPLPPGQAIGLLADIQPERYIPQEMQAGASDSALTVLGLPPDYSPLKTDGDGRQYLTDHAILDLLYYDATQDPWHTPGAGFYGAGRDGIWYYDGQACQFGNFGTLAGGFNNRSWSRCGGPTTNTEKMGLWWYSGRSSVTMVADDTVRIANLNGTNWETIGIRNAFRWTIAGDFDIQINFANFTPLTGPSDGNLGFEFYVDGENYFYVRRHTNYNTQQYDKDVRIDGSWRQYQTAGTAGASGKLRLVRSGSNVSSYYWNGSSWSQIGSTYSGFPTRNGYINIFVGGTGTYNYQADISAFTINAGTVVNTAGWAREVAGAYRGSRADFPTHALIAVTSNGLDIIDADNNKMWMRFEKGSNRMLFNWGVNTQRPRQVAMRDGQLLLAYGAHPDDGEEGAGILVDFNVDGIFMSRDTGSSNTGTPLRYAEWISNEWWMNGLPQGVVQGRNSGKGWLNWDWGQYRIQGYRVLGVDIANSGGYNYTLFATSNGMTVRRWHRWYLEGSTPDALGGPDSTYASTAGPFYGCYFDQASLRLFYHSVTTLYYADQATWTATLTAAGNTTFTPGGSVVLPGTSPEGFAIRRKPRLIGATLFVCAGDGVYTTAWPTTPGDTWHKTYGAVGSDATYPLLPTGMIVSYNFRTDSGTVYLIVTTKNPRYGRVLTVINTTTNTVYDRIVLTSESVAAVA